MKRVLFTVALLAVVFAARADFNSGQVLTAAQLNAAFATKVDVSAITVNVKTYLAGTGGDDLAKFNSAASAAGTNGQVLVPAGAYVLSGTTTAATWLVDANATFSGAGKLGGRIVKFGNGGASAHATKIGSPGAWLEAERIYTENNADLVVLSSIGQGGIIGGSRTSDFGTAGSMGSIGLQGWAINDNAAQVQSGYAGYFEARRKAGAGTTHGIEIDVVNQDPTTVVNHPFSMGATGSTPALWLASGGEISATPASLAIGVIANGTTFDKGLVFGATSLTGANGVTGTATAIALAKGHALQWYGAGGVGIGYINNTVATSSAATNLNFSDSGAAITGASGQMLALIPPVASAVNYLAMNAATAGNNVSLSAAGSDANISLTLSPKGFGSVAVANGYLDVANSHVWSNIAGAALPGNSTSTGSSLIGWNRSSGGGEMNFVNAKGAGGAGGFDWRIWNGSSDTKIAGLDASGNLSAIGSVKSSGATGGVGYTTGAGGTVTQATSKTTGATLNTVTGQITMNGAALAAAATACFTLTNSAIAATDVVNAVIASGATAGAYTLQVDAVAAGSTRMCLNNRSAGSLSEAVVINYAVIKGSAN